MKINNWTVRQKFRNAIENVNGIPDSDNRAWENINFAPSKDTPWIRETMIYGDKRLSANEELSATGVAQYDLFYPIGGGTKDQETVASNIEEAFEPATVLDGLVRCDWAQAEQGRKDPSEAWWHIPVRIGYTVFSIN